MGLLHADLKARDSPALDLMEAVRPQLNADVDFVHDILPRLQAVPLCRIMKATGFSLRYCLVIRRGLHVPHPQHWHALKRLASET